MTASASTAPGSTAPASTPPVSTEHVSTDHVSTDHVSTAPGSTAPLAGRRRYADLLAAGRELADVLAPRRGEWSDAIVLGIARGGVPAAIEVSRALALPLDVLLLRRLFALREDGTYTSAVSVGGVRVLDPEVEARTAAGGPGARAAVADALAELDARDALCRGDRAPAEVRDRTVLLVDNGIHTGFTARIAIRAVRALRPARLIVATPAAAPSVLPTIAAEVDEVVALAGDEPFGNVGMWYARLDVPGFDRIGTLLREAGEKTHPER